MIVKSNLGEEETVLCARCGRVFAVYRAIRLRGLLLRGTVCAEEKEDAEAREKAARERSREKKRDGERWKGTNAVGGSWRRNDYRPRTHSLPAIISSTNATKSIESSHRKSSLQSRADSPARC